jgi:hypothetical protein
LLSQGELSHNNIIVAVSFEPIAEDGEGQRKRILGYDGIPTIPPASVRRIVICIMLEPGYESQMDLVTPASVSAFMWNGAFPNLRTWYNTVTRGQFNWNNSVLAAGQYDIFRVQMTAVATAYSSYINAAVSFLGTNASLWQHLMLIVPMTSGANNAYVGYGLGSVSCGSRLANCFVAGVDPNNLNLWNHELG